VAGEPSLKPMHLRKSKSAEVVFSEEVDIHEVDGSWTTLSLPRSPGVLRL